MDHPKARPVRFLLRLRRMQEGVSRTMPGNLSGKPSISSIPNIILQGESTFVHPKKTK
jgi:hypothetical protein